jgi:hypothetical protein
MSALYLPKTCSQYGASMGRHSAYPPADYRGPLVVRRVKLDSGGYDAGGAYWGNGAKLWQAEDPDGYFSYYFRAVDYMAAKREARIRSPLARVR